jgi:hypothetical protein
MTIDPVPAGLAMDSIEPFTAEPSTFTKVAYGTKRYDTENRFDENGKRFTAATSGDYRVCAALASPADEFELDIAINGNRENAFAGSRQGAASGCRTVRLNQGQYVEVLLYHGAKSAVKFAPTKHWNWLTVDKVPGKTTQLDVSLDNSNAFALPPNTPTKISYVNKLYDDAGLFDVQSGRFTAPAPHDYRICASMTSLSQDFELNLYVNGAREKALTSRAAGTTQGCRTIRLKKAGDFVEVWANQSTGGSLTLDTNQFWNWMTVEPAHHVW